MILLGYYYYCILMAFLVRSCVYGSHRDREWAFLHNKIFSFVSFTLLLLVIWINYGLYGSVHSHSLDKIIIIILFHRGFNNKNIFMSLPLSLSQLCEAAYSMYVVSFSTIIITAKVVLFQYFEIWRWINDTSTYFND